MPPKNTYPPASRSSARLASHAPKSEPPEPEPDYQEVLESIENPESHKTMSAPADISQETLDALMARITQLEAAAAVPAAREGTAFDDGAYGRIPRPDSYAAKPIFTKLADPNPLYSDAAKARGNKVPVFEGQKEKFKALL